MSQNQIRPHSKLTPKRVREARWRYWGSSESCAPIAADFGVTRQTIYEAVQCKTWKTVGGMPDDMVRRVAA